MKIFRNKDIIDDIIYTLKKQNESYLIGAWENFLKKRKKRKRRKKIALVIYYSSGIAASLIVAHFIFTSYLSNQNSNNKISLDMDCLKETSVNNEIDHQTLLKRKNNIEVSLIKAKSLDKNISVMVDNFENRKKVGLFLDKLENEQEMINEKTSFIDTNITKSINNLIADNKKLINKNRDSIPTINRDSIFYKADLFADEDELETVKQFKRLRLGIVTQEFTNFVSSNLATKMSYGVGVVSYIKLNRKISIGTGLILDKYNLNYELEPEFFSGPTSSSVELVCLDIPINLNISIFEFRKNNLFITSGISTLGLLQETYKYQYMLGEDTENTVNFENINIAGQINLSIGWEYKLTENFNVGIEGYTKIPVYKLAEENLQFYVYGISLKVSK